MSLKCPLCVSVGCFECVTGPRRAANYLCFECSPHIITEIFHKLGILPRNEIITSADLFFVLLLVVAQVSPFNLLSFHKQSFFQTCESSPHLSKLVSSSLLPHLNNELP